MKKIYILFCLITLLLTASPARASYVDLGVAGEFNVFVFNDYTNTSDTQGRLAVGGDAYLYGYSVGHYLPSGSSGSSLVVGGNLYYYGGEVQNGDVTVAGTSTTSFTVRDGDLYTGATLPFDFAAEEAYLTALSITLSSLASNGTVVDNTYGTLTLVGDGTSAFQIFYLDGADLLNASTLLIDQIAEDATILINVSGSSIALASMGLSDLAEYSSNILFNFYEATELTLTSIGFEGSILAPLADVEANWGQINGTVIASSYNGTMEQHYNPFESGTPVPEPGTFLILGFGLLALTAFMWRRRVKANA